MIRKILMLIFILALTGITSIWGSSENSSGWYIEKFGHYKKGEGKVDHLVERATAVFERVKNVVDMGISPLPRLYFIGEKKKAVALALPDGGIIISPKTLDICYGGVKTDEGDCRIAFILGHELAHLANQDFGRYKTWQALIEMGNKKDRKELFQFFETSSDYEKGNELEADRNGALFAAMAGYKIAPLLRGKNNFLRYWVRKVGEDPSYPAVEKRVKSVRIQLQAVKEKAKLFRAGVLFLQMGKYIDGAAVFRAFSNSYPAREVFNNIGACYLNLALRYLRLKFSDDYFRFRLATAIDYYTSAEKLYFRGEGDYLKDRDISYCIDRAVFYFREAAYRDRHERTCRLNLAAASILKKNYAAALAECDFLLEKNSQDIDALNNKAIALCYYGKMIGIDTPRKAIQILQKANLLESTNFEVLYNLAALAREMKQSVKAKSLWEKYLNLPNIPRDNFYTYICKKLKRKELPSPTQTQASRLPVLPKEIQLGKESAPLLEKWDGEKVREYKLTSEEKGEKSWSAALQVIIKQNLRVLAWEGFIVLVEQEFICPKKPAELLKRFGPPQKVIHHTAGIFHVYEENGFSLKEVDGMICSYIWFKKDF